MVTPSILVFNTLFDLVTSTITTSPSMGGKKLNFSHPPPIRPIFRSNIKTKIDIVKKRFEEFVYL